MAPRTAAAAFGGITMGFGKKGLASGQGPGSVSPSGSGFGAAPHPADDLAAKKEAFLAAEHARRKADARPIATAAAPLNAENHDPLGNLHNVSRPAQPMGENLMAQGPVGASGLTTAQEAEIRASARGMVRGQSAESGAVTSSVSGANSTRRSGGNSNSFFGEPSTRNTSVAYVWWFFLGQFSMHRFYCGQKDTAIIQMTLWIASLVILFIFPPAGIVGLLVWFCWLVGDLFTIPAMLREFKANNDYREVFA